MNIIFLTHEFVQRDAPVGGAGNYVYNIASVLACNGHKVYVIVDMKRTETFEYDGIEVHYINATRGFKNTGKPMSVPSKLLKNIGRSFWYNREVAKIISQNNIDIVQSVGTYGIPFFRNKKVPYIVRFSEHEPLWVGASKEKFIFSDWAESKRLDYLFWAKAYKKADAFFAPSEFVKNIIEEQSGCNVDVIESPVNAHYIVKDTSNILEKYCLEEGQYWITYCAMTLRKSIHIVAKIVDKLLNHYKSMKYVVVGKDNYITYQNQRIKASQIFYSCISSQNLDRFVFIDGIYDKGELYYLIKKANMCILPSRIDNLANSVLEAMSLKKIVVSSDQTSSEQLIMDGYNGFLAEIDNEQQLYEKVVSAMQLPKEEREEIEKRAKERVEHLTPDAVCNQVIKFYEKTIRDFCLSLIEK